jgi:hypothetical protein
MDGAVYCASGHTRSHLLVGVKNEVRALEFTPALASVDTALTDPAVAVEKEPGDGQGQ